MKFVNFWRRPITLAASALSCPLNLEDGTYRLTISDSETSPSAWEIVDAVVAAGQATLTRAREGTVARLWPSGSVIYCALTAGQLTEIFSFINGGGSLPVTALTDGAGNNLVDGAGNQLTSGATQ